MLEKGEFVANVLEDLKKKGDADFVFCIGDDTSDEPMFKKLNLLCNYKDKEQLNGRMMTKDCPAFTCTVGRKPSHARYYVNDYKDTFTILREMASWSVKVKWEELRRLVTEE